MQKDTPEVADISKQVQSIASHVPLVKSLEKRLDIMKGLDPLMDGILERMNEVTDNSNLRQIQADARVKKTTEHLNHAMNRLDMVNRGNPNLQATPALYNTAILPPAPLTKEELIHDVVRKTLNKIEGQTTNYGDEMHGKSAAVDAINKAAANGAFSRDMHDLSGRPDFEVHHSTVVDHRGHPLLPPAVVGQETSVIENTPESATVSNENKASVVLGYEPRTVVSNGGSKQILHKSAGVVAPQPYA